MRRQWSYSTSWKRSARCSVGAGEEQSGVFHGLIKVTSPQHLLLLFLQFFWYITWLFDIVLAVLFSLHLLKCCLLVEAGVVKLTEMRAGEILNANHSGMRLLKMKSTKRPIDCSQSPVSVRSSRSSASHL